MKILGKEIKNEISWGSVLAIFTILSAFVTGIYSFSANFQEIRDQINIIKIENAHTLEITTRQAEVVQREIEENKSRQDERETVIDNSLNQINEHINNLTNYLLGRQHGDIGVLPNLASVNANPKQDSTLRH